MLSELFAEISAVAAALKDGNESGINTGLYETPVGAHETQVGVIEDPWIRAIMLVSAKHLEDLEAMRDNSQDIFAMSPSKMRAAANKTGLLQRMVRFIWDDLRASYTIPDGGGVGIRSGWTIVTFDSGRRGIQEALKQILRETDCGDPDCLVHGQLAKTF